MVRGEPECPSCEIRLEAVLTLGGLNGPGLATISRTSDVAVDAAGRILVAGGGVPDHVAVFDSLGTFLRTVGRRGQGPGEFMYISHIAPGSGSVHLFDALLKRRTILDGDLEFVDVHRIDGQVRSSVALEDGNLLFFADIPTASRVAEPLHILGPNGELVSFGADGSVYRGRLPEQTVAGRENAIWTLESLRYRISRWDLSERRRVALFDLAAAWFDAEDSNSWPRSFLAGIREDAHGLWVIGETPDNRWTERAVKEGPIPTNPPSEVFDGVLDVVDPETGRTIAHGRWDDVFVGFVAGSDLIAMYRESVEGVPYIDLVRASLHRSLRNPHSRR